MDIQMPIMDGVEAARQIRAMGVPTSIIALTAHAKKTDRERYIALGMDGYLAKPIRVDDLYRVLSGALAESA
jgi:CheY-like chemotaxis protein